MYIINSLPYNIEKKKREKNFILNYTTIYLIRCILYDLFDYNIISFHMLNCI